MMKKGIYAILAALAVFALVLTGCPDGGGNSSGGDDLYKVTFSANGATGGTVPAALEQKTKGEALTIPGNTGNLVKTDYTFGGWNEKADGTGKTYAAGDKITPTKETPLYAKWEGGGGSDLYARAEKVTLNNSWYAVYRFELPAGKTWEDYKGISADYLFTEEDMENAVARGARLMGPYKPADFTFFTGTGDADGKNLAVANYNAGKNNQFILDNNFGWGKWTNNETDGTLIKNLADKGVTAEADKWFTLEYKINGSNKFTGSPAYDDANMPADTDTGPFYFGVGIAGQNNDGNVQYIRDVKMIGFDATVPDVFGIPAYFEKDGTRYPVFTGYNTPDGSNGYGDADRAMVDGTEPPAVQIIEAEKLVLNNSWYAVYKFTLPAGKTWEDYKGISADYLFTEEDMENAVARGARLMGPYKPADFTFFTGTETGTAPGKVLAVANYNAGKNNQFILDNNFGWGKWTNNETDGTLIKNLADKGVTAEADKWFTLEYKIDGSNKFTGSPAYDDANMPADTDTGPFYFGVGIAGQNNDGNVQYIANVKMIGFDATVPDVFGIPATLDNPDDVTQINIPVFTGYNTPDGSNGYAEASRIKVTLVK